MTEPYWEPLGGIQGPAGPAGAAGPAGPTGPAGTPAILPSYGTSLPASPVDGQEAILVDNVTSPNWQWRFRYNAASTSFKWEFIGGSDFDAVTYIGAETLPNANVWSPMPTFTDIVIPRSGVYICRFGAQFTIQGATNTNWQLAVANASVSNNPITASAMANLNLANFAATISGQYDIQMSAGQTIRIVYYQNVANSQCGYRWMSIQPKRVT